MADKERKYYVLCELNCKFEGMTKEQIITAIAEATGVTPTNIDDAFITKIKEQNKGGAIKLWRGTVAEYNAIETKDADTVYIKTDDTRDADVAAAIQGINKEIENINKTTDAHGAAIESINEEIESINKEIESKTPVVTETTMAIKTNETKGEIEYTPVFDRSYIVVDVKSCHNLEIPEAYQRDVCISVLPLYVNYSSTKNKRIIAYRNDSSTAKIDIRLNIIEVPY